MTRPILKGLPFFVTPPSIGLRGYRRWLPTATLALRLVLVALFTIGASASFSLGIAIVLSPSLPNTISAGFALVSGITVKVAEWLFLSALATRLLAC
jgi:hypothetical protein